MTHNKKAWMLPPVPAGVPELVDVVSGDNGSGLVVVKSTSTGQEKRANHNLLFGSFDQAVEAQMQILSDKASDIRDVLRSISLGLSFLSSSDQDSFGEMPDALSSVNGIRRWSSFDDGPGVYVLCLGGDIVYVGQSINLRSRIISHSKNSIFDSVFCVDVSSKDQRDVFESVLIATLDPPFNRSNSPLSGKRIKSDHFAKMAKLVFDVKNAA